MNNIIHMHTRTAAGATTPERSNPALVTGFDFHGFTVRAMIINRSPFFHADDVGELLEVEDMQETLDALEPDQKMHAAALDGKALMESVWISAPAFDLLLTDSIHPDAGEHLATLHNNVLNNIIEAQHQSIAREAQKQPTYPQALRYMAAAEEHRQKAFRQIQPTANFCPA